MKCGLLGRTLGHSYSPRIHRELGDYEYRLYETEPEALEAFLLRGDWDGLNVTIPYKKAVVPYCAALSDTARALGSVNTLVRRADGSLYGDNTDFGGFESLVLSSGIPVAGQKALVLGSGGASVTVCAVLRKLGAAVTVVSRHGPDNYENLEKHRDAGILANTTPVGMYPNCGVSPVDLSRFPACRGVFDVVYNPARTALLLQAESLGIPHAGGLHMLVAQARRSSERFTGRAVPDAELARIEKLLLDEMQNVILIGMPGCGKTTVGRALAKLLGRPFADADAELVRAVGTDIPAYFREHGEAAFRERETEVLRQLGQRSGLVIATGGGCVTREENYPLLHQNGRIVWLRRELSQLPTAGRPVSQANSPDELWRARRPLYERFSDLTADAGASVRETAEHIREALL